MIRQCSQCYADLGIRLLLQFVFVATLLSSVNVILLLNDSQQMSKVHKLAKIQIMMECNGVAVITL